MTAAKQKAAELKAQYGMEMAVGVAARHAAGGSVTQRLFWGEVLNVLVAQAQNARLAADYATLDGLRLDLEMKLRAAVMAGDFASSDRITDQLEHLARAMNHVRRTA